MPRTSPFVRLKLRNQVSSPCVAQWLTPGLQLTMQAGNSKLQVYTMTSLTEMLEAFHLQLHHMHSFSGAVPCPSGLPKS